MLEGHGDQAASKTKPVPYFLLNATLHHWTGLVRSSDGTACRSVTHCRWRVQPVFKGCALLSLFAKVIQMINRIPKCLSPINKLATCNLSLRPLKYIENSKHEPFRCSGAEAHERLRIWCCGRSRGGFHKAFQCFSLRLDKWKQSKEHEELNNFQ